MKNISFSSGGLPILLSAKIYKKNKAVALKTFKEPAVVPEKLSWQFLQIVTITGNTIHEWRFYLN